MKANRRLLTMILASALTFGIANAKNDEYKHDNCYSYMRGLEAVQNEDNDEAIKYLKAEVEQHPNCDRAYQQRQSRGEW